MTKVFVAVILGLGACTGALAQWTSLDLRINDFVYDDSRELLYATIQATQPGIGSSIAVIDPRVPQIVATTPLPSAPVKVALSTSNNTLFFGLDSQARVGSYDVASATFLGSFALGSHKSGPSFRANDLAVIPGSENTVAISRSYGTNSHGGLVVFSSGVQLPNAIHEAIDNSLVEFGDQPTRLYGYNSRTTESGFRRMNVDASGVQMVDTEYFELGNQISWFEGRVYGASGYFVQPEPFPELAGRFPASGWFGINPHSRYIYFMSPGTSPKITVCDLDTFALVRVLQLPELNAHGRGMVRWGDSGIAVYTNEARVYFHRSSGYWRQLVGEVLELLTGPGVVQSGSLDSIRSSDNSYLVAVPGVVFSSGQSPVRFTVTAEVQNLSEHLNISIESRASSGGVLQTVSALNRTSNSFETLAQKVISTADGIHSIDIFEDGGRFVDQATKQVVVRVEYKSTGPVFAYPWQISVDQIGCITPNQ